MSVNSSLAESALFSFGIISDIQYADVDDGSDFSKTRTRYYRGSAALLEGAVRAFGEHRRPVAFVLQLGDLVDRLASVRNDQHRSVRFLIDLLAPLRCPVYHSWGNHDLNCFTRDQLLLSPLYCADGSAGLAHYYAFEHGGVRFVQLDTYEFAAIGYAPDAPMLQRATAYLRQRNGNENLNKGDGLSGLDTRFRQYNGGVSRAQLEWLGEQLAGAAARRQNVVVFGHAPVHPSSADAPNLLWNFDDVLRVLDAHRCVVLCYMAGHDHDGGHHFDAAAAIHYLTMPGVIERPPGANAYAVCDVAARQLTIANFGNHLVPARLHIPLKWPLPSSIAPLTELTALA